MGKFKVGDKVEFVSESKSGLYTRGKVYEVIEVLGNREYRIEDNEGRRHLWNDIELMHKNFRLVDSKLTKNQRITALEKEVAELKLIVHELRGKQVEPSTEEEVIEFEGAKYRKVDREARVGDVVTFKQEADFALRVDKLDKYLVFKSNNGVLCINWQSNDVSVYNNAWNRTPETVDVYELIVEDKPKVEESKHIRYIGEIKIPVAKSPNQQRAEIIDKAKKFVEVKSECLKDSPFVTGGFERKEKENPNYNSYIMEVEFFTNEEKRIVTALCKAPSSGLVRTKGIAKCNPSDVFNEHTGKAIALGRALGLDVSEFEQAVQPTEVVVGQEVISYRSKNSKEIHVQGEIIKNVYDGFKFREEDYRKWIGRDAGYTSAEYGYKIINDTNAQYGGVE